MKNSFTAILMVMAASMVGCDNPMEDYVQETVELSVDQVRDDGKRLTLEGDLTFKHTSYWTEYRTECDRVVCGSEREYRCHTRTRCVRRDGHKETCTTYRDCGYEDVPKYCDTNCRQIPYTESSTRKTVSPVKIDMTRKDGGGVRKNRIDGLYFGVNTNAKFRDAIDHPSSQPEGTEFLFRDLTRDDDTLLVLKAKGYRLAAGQSYLRLPEDFKAGDVIRMNVLIERTGDSDDTIYSAVGSVDQFPELHTSSQ